ncbi:MAG TPA: restriction endonuclease [Mycobacteriales bacterium]|nr:restriction endonuclease [Mycobacteriales bacterium]
MLSLNDPITRVSTRIDSAAWAELDIYTVGDLLLHFPVRITPAPPRRVINELRHLEHAAVAGWVAHNNQQLMEVDGYHRRVWVPVTYLRDRGAVPLHITWLEDRRNPPDLRVGDHLVVAGTAWTVRKGVRHKLLSAGMSDPDFTWIRSSNQIPTPGIDGPEVDYVDSEAVPSYAIIATVWHALSNVQLPGVPGHASPDEFRDALRCSHAPQSSEQNQWAYENRTWMEAAIREATKARPRMPEPRLIKTPQDAELMARDVMRSLGFAGAEVTPAGRDGGVDVRARGALAQVKLEGVKTDAPRVQALLGIAQYNHAQALFFSLAGYTTAAVAWAEQTRMALFEFDYVGGVVARSSEAHRLLVQGA